MNEHLLLEISKRELEAPEATELLAAKDPHYFSEDFTVEPKWQGAAEKKL